MPDSRCLMVVHAHPDDEVFSTGGIIAHYAREGYRVVVVYATSGEAGEIHDPDLDPDDARIRLGDIRQEEARHACAVLGATDVYFLGYRDSGMKDTLDNENPKAFMSADFDLAVDKLCEIMRATSPAVVVTYDESGGYGHPDHIMTHRVAVGAFERAQRESWGPSKLYFSARSREGFRRYVEGLRSLGLAIPWVKDDFKFEEYGVPDDEITASIDISDLTELKQRALALHRTQIKSDHFYLSIPGKALSEVSGHEYFVRVSPPPIPGQHETDLFEGVRDSGEAVA